MEFIINTPKDFKQEFLDQIFELVTEGAQVDMNGLRQRILAADLIAVAIEDKKVIATAMLKNPSNYYKHDVFKKAGVAEMADDFPKELGYIVTATGHEGKKVCQRLLIEFMPRINMHNIYATTRKASMRRILEKFDFLKEGNTYNTDLELFTFKRLNLLDFIAKSSIHVVVARASDLLPVSFGSGCIVQYKNRMFLLSVAHVTDLEGTVTLLETNLPSKNLQTPFYQVGAMCYFDQFKVPKSGMEQKITAIEDINAKYDKTLDITFCEIKENVDFLQPEWDLGAFKIRAGRKIFLNLEEAGEPQKNKLYGLSGRVRQNLNGVYLEQKPTMKLNLQYQGQVKSKKMYGFSTEELISDADDYRGCSGAPILDEDGKLVALAASVYEGSKMMLAFSIEECKRLLDFAIESKLV